MEIEFDAGRREYYRARPSPAQPVFFRTSGRDWSVRDISAGGMALATGSLTTGNTYSGKLILPGHEDPIRVSLSVLHTRYDKTAACVINEISEQDRERLHQFVLLLQKKQIEENRKKRIKEYQEMQASQRKSDTQA